MKNSKLLWYGGLVMIIVFPMLAIFQSNRSEQRKERADQLYYDYSDDDYADFEEYDSYESSPVAILENADGSPLYDDQVSVEHLSISEPVTYKNLQICLLTGVAQINQKRYYTLNDALKADMATLHETSNVNELRIDNNSSEWIYINAGDIVKGGKQDRTIQYDVVIAPQQMNVNLASFCVEHDRWTRRGQEDQHAFASSEKSIPSKDLKMAMRVNKDQSVVWNEVSQFQDNSNASLNQSRTDGYIDVKNSQSSSSLELTLENEELTKWSKNYKDYFIQKIIGNKNSLGFAYYINGELYGVELYNNHRLFKDMADKLLDAAIAEAISELHRNKINNGVSITGLARLLPADAKVFTEESVNESTLCKRSEHNKSKDVMIFTTYDLDRNLWLHRSWLSTK